MANPFSKEPTDLVLDEMNKGGQASIPPAPKVERVLPKAPKASTEQRMTSLMPIFEKAAVDNDVPLNVMLALGWQESSFNPSAVGQPTKWGTAKGVMQYLDGTANGLGIDPLDPEQAINAAAKQLRQRLDNGYSMEDAVKEHFAGPNRELWGEKTNVYGKEVLERANIIATRLGAEAPKVDFTNTPPSPLKPEHQNAWSDARGLPKPFADDDSTTIQPPKQAQQPNLGSDLPITKDISLAKADGSPIDQSVMKPYEPTVWDKILDLIGPNRDAAAVELAARRIAEREGKDVREIYNEAGGSRSVFNPEGRAPLRAAAEAGKVVYDQKGDIIPGAANAALRAARGGDTSAEDSMLDKAISATDVKPHGYQDPNYTSFQGIGQSLGYSAATMVPALVAGAAGTAAGGPIAGGAAAMGASGGVAYRSSKDQFLSDIRSKAEREVGRRLTQPELDKVVSDADEAATMYGAWEAIPEALSSVIMMRAIVAPLKGATRSAKVADLSRRFATEQASEQGTETATAWGQNKAELMAGLTNYDMSLGEAFRQQAIPTLFTTATMGGAGHAARAAYDAAQSKEQKLGRAMNERVEATQLQADPREAIAAFDPNNGQPVQPVPSGPLGRAMQNAPTPVVAQSAPLPEPMPQQAAPAVQEAAPAAQQAAQAQEVEQQSPQQQGSQPAQPQRVNVTIAGEDTAATVLEQMPEGIMVQDERGDKYLLPTEAIQSGEVTITPIEPPAQQAAEIQQQAPAVQQPREEQKPYEQMTAGELNQLLAYINGLAKVNGWNETLAQEKAKVDDAIATLREREIYQRDDDDTENDEPQAWGSMRSMFETEFRHPEVNNEPEQVREPENGSALVPENTAQDGKTRPADLPASREVAQVRSAGAGRVPDNAGMVVADNGASVSATAQPADTKPALTEIAQVLGADGKPKWFGSKPKAVEFIEKKGLSGTHEVKKVGQKWEILPKDQQEKTQQQTEIADRPAASVSGETVTAPAQADASPIEQPSSKSGQLPATKPQDAQQASVSSNPADESGVVKESLHSSFEIEQAIGKFASGRESAKIEHDKGRGDYAIVVDGIELGRSPSRVLTQSQALQTMLRTYKDAMDRDGRAFSTNPKDMTRDQFIMFAEAGMVNDVSVTLDQVSQHAGGGFRVDYGKVYDEMQASSNQSGNGASETQTPEQWKAEAEAALSRLPDTHPLKKKWAANVKHGLKSASDRSAVLNQINGAIERTAPYQDQAKEQDKQEQKTKTREQTRKEQAQRAIDRSVEAIGAKKGETVQITGKVGYAGDNVYTVEDIDSKGNVYLKSDTGSTDVSPAEIQRAKAQGTTFAKVEDQASAPLAELSEQAVQQPADKFAGNKLFTAEKVAAARARLKSKMSQLNSGIDPEVLIDGMTIAGAYIEAGVRDFRAYTKAMTEDFGDKIKPYLLSFWEGARNYPGLDTEGMTSVDDSAKAHAEFNKELPKEEAKALGSEVKKPAKRTKKTGSKGDTTLTQDWGVDYIDGHGDNYERETGSDVKDRFMKDAAKYLGALADTLQAAGFTQHDGKKPISKNEGGPAVSGDVTLTLRNQQTGKNIYVHVGGGALRGTVPTTQSGISVMYRVSGKEGDTFATSGTNRWAPVDMSATDLAAIINKEAGGSTPELARQPIEGNKNDTQTVEAGDRNGDQEHKSDRVQAHEADRAHRASTGRTGSAVQSERGGRAAGSTEQASGEESDAGSAPSGVRGNRASGHAAGARADQSNYRIQAGELTRTGSWKATAENNVKIVELVKQLMKEGRPATASEKAQLTKFTGWGASEIANGIFPNQYGQYKDSSWRELGERLKAALTEEEYAQARRTTQYAHYTSEPIIRSVYKAMDRMGFNGGNVLEPGMGVGLFNGLMPDSIASNSDYTGIEYDTITGNIAKLLYPGSNMIVGDYTQTKLPRDFFDVAIGNPPFGAIKIQSDPEYKKQGFMLHDYFFAKTIDRVKPGGLLVFVTSKGTMDKANDRARKYLSERADLVGAIRLPQTAFKDNAGTEVVTDVIFLRKRAPGQDAAGEQWGGMGEVQTNQGPAMVNEYFAAHPEMVLGRHAKTGSMYRADEYTVEPIEGNIEELFSKAIENLPENIYRPERGSHSERAAVQRRDYDPKVKKEGGVYIADDGTLMQVESGQGVPLNSRIGSTGKELQLKPKEVEWLNGYTTVRDALKQAQYDQLNDGAWEKSLKALNEKYDAFTKKHGPILAHTVIERESDDGTTSVTKRFKNQPLIQMDAEGALAYALEEIKTDGSIVKAPVLLGRTLNKPKQPNITSVQDAMFVSLNEIGRFDLKAIAKLSGKTEQDVVSELSSEIYQDPANGWTTADDYLSGNVVRKLKEAEAAARINKDYERNIEALKIVQPRPLASSDITVQLGSAWVPPSDVQQFASEVINEPGLEINYSPVTGQWQVKGQASRVSEWGIPQRTTDEILESVLNNRQIKITYKDDGNKTHTDAEATEKANDLAKKMRAEFKKWIWADNDRASRLTNYYNEHYNNIAPRQFDGSHLTLPGVSSRFNLRPHQKRAIWRTIQEGDTYYAHAVGAGKTFTMIASGMEERRLGLVKKPMYVVPNHMLAQFSKEFLELYPTASIMVADEQNFHTHNRRKFVAQAALNDPDAIVITHSAFGRIGMSDEFAKSFLGSQISDWRAALDETDKQDRVTVKQIERRIEQLENRLKSITEGAKDRTLTFEELGVDRLYVDEGHEFRKLDFPTNRANIKGIDSSGSQRAMDLMMKVQYLREKNPGRALVMASGTPITNTMGELYTVQRFFQPEILEEDGDSSFDAWANHYGEVVDGLEQNAAGGYETVSRFARFVNVPELMSRVRSVMDILTSNQLGDLVQRPDVDNGGRQVVVTPVPDGYKDYQKNLESRIKAIRNRRGPPKPGDDIILSVIADGRFSAIDMRFVDPTMPSDPNSKLNTMLDDLIEVYHATADNEYATGGTVDPVKGSSMMLFTDIGLGEQSAKNRGFDMKAWIEKRLLEGGVKPEHIAFMRDHKAHAKKERLFDDLRQGRKRILIGGKDMETGVNAQKRLAWLGHLDAPWFPASVEQREGRIVRQGNQNKAVAIKAYATKGSYDSTMWGMNARKARFIEQAMSGDTSVRSMDDVSEASAFEMAAALASGDERYMKLAGLNADVYRLNRLYSAHMDDQRRLRSDKVSTEGAIRFNKEKASALDEAIAKRTTIKAGSFSGKVGGKTFDNREEFGAALIGQFTKLANDYTDGEKTIGSIGGFDIKYQGVEMRGGNFAAEAYVDAPTEADPLMVFPQPSEVSPAGVATRAVNIVNGLDREKATREQRVAEFEGNLTRINKRLGVAFPEAAELTEKKESMAELEAELEAESAAEDVEANDSATTEQANGEEDGRHSIGDGSVSSVSKDPLIKSLVDSGKIVIHDTTDTLPSQRKGGVAGFTAADGTIHVVGNNLSVVLHEAFHSGGKALLGDKRWQNLISRLESMHKAAKSGDGFWKGAADRVAHAGVTGKLAAEEFGAYAIENYDRAPSGVKKWVESIVGAVQAWLYRRFGIQAGKVTAAQLRSLAKAALRSMNEPGPAGPNGGSRMIEAYSQGAGSNASVDPVASRTLTKAMPIMLRGLSLDRMIEELGKGMPSLKAYLRDKRDMDAYRNALHNRHDKIANDWLKFNMLHPSMGKLLSSIMHKSTIEQVDPTLPFVETITDSDRYEAEMNPDSPEGKAAAERIADDERRFAAWKELKDDFNKLPEKGQSLYKTVRDAYLDQVIELDKILVANIIKALDVQAQRAERKYKEEVQRIYDEGMAGDERDEALRKAENKYISASTKHKYNKSARILELRRKFESNRLTGPYFPLARFGNYFVTGRDQEGKVVEFSKFENPTDQQRFAVELEKEGLEVQQGYLYDSEQLKKAIDSGFVADIDEILSSAEVSDAVKDQIWQRYIDSMPEMSMRKKFKHRKNREGYNKDALRAFASQMFHGAHQMARLKYGAQMTEHIEQSKHDAKAAKDPVRAAQVVNEVEQKHQFVMNPTGSQWVQNLSALGFVYHLTSPASALVNFAQTYMLGVPILGAKFGRFGMTRAGYELTRAMKDFTMGMGHIGNRKSLSSDERAAINYAYDLGVADRTQSHDLAGIGENGSAYSPLRAAVMRKLGWAFHQVERMNREVTYIAAYRMSRAKGMSHTQAMENAAELTWKVHFNYDNSNRPRMMQTDAAKVFLMFRNYQVNMLWRLFRDAHQVFNGASKEERSEALKQLGGIAGMMALSTGIRGVWLYGIAMVIANMMFGDDAEDKMKKGLIETVGKTGAGIIMNGLGGHLTGIDLSGRVGMPDLWVRSPDQNLEGKEIYTYLLEQIFGPLGGIANNAFVGLQMAADGNPMRGAETASPTAIKSALRAYRYGTEGANTLKGEPVVQDLSYADIIKQAIGFTPIKVAEQYRTNRVMKNKEQEISDARSSLMSRYNMAMRKDNDEEIDKVLAEIDQYNDEHPEWSIKPKDRRASYRSFRKSMNRMDGGIIINKKLEGMIRDGTAPNIYQDDLEEED